MSAVTFTDDDGSWFTMCKFKGELFRNTMNFEFKYEELTDMTARSSDVVITGYPKCGCNWMWDIIYMVLAESKVIASETKLRYMLEHRFSEVAYFDKTSSPRIFNSHLPYSLLPYSFKRNQCKLVYLIRNPKDVCVSYYNHIIKTKEQDCRLSWNAYLRFFLDGKVPYGSYFEHIKQWQRDMNENPDLPILTLYYENLKQNFQRELQKLCDFLEVKLSKEFLQFIEQTCSFENMKTEKLASTSGCWELYDVSCFFRKGVIGDWKNWLTVAQNEHFDRVSNEVMGDMDMEFIFEEKTQMPRPCLTSV